MIPDKQQRASDRRKIDAVHAIIGLGIFMLIVGVWAPLWGKL